MFEAKVKITYTFKLFIYSYVLRAIIIVNQQDLLKTKILMVLLTLIIIIIIIINPYNDNSDESWYNVYNDTKTYGNISGNGSYCFRSKKIRI